MLHLHLALSNLRCVEQSLSIVKMFVRRSVEEDEVLEIPHVQWALVQQAT